jgi:hypothetical protein
VLEAAAFADMERDCEVKTLELTGPVRYVAIGKNEMAGILLHAAMGPVERMAASGLAP